MLSSVEVASVAAAPAAEPIVVVESERGITVEVAGAQRAFDDPEQRCGQRASQAGVFIALMLDPLRLPATPPSVPPVRPQPAPVRERAPLPAPPAKAALRLILAAAPGLLVAPGSALRETPLAVGLGARLRWGDALSLSGGIGFWSTTTLHYAQADARERLLVLDLGVSWGIRRPAWGLGAELSPVLAPALVRGEHVEHTRAGWRVEWGARASLYGEWWPARRFGIFLSESALFWPRPISLNVGGLGDVGHTPAFWFGSQLGLVARVD